MMDLPVFNREGKEVDRFRIGEALLGGRIRPALLKQAVVMYHANRRQGSAANKSRGMVKGSTHKLYRQKGTGRARAGSARTVIRRGGGVAFAKSPRDFRRRMPQKQRRLARNCAVLAKMQSEDAVIIDQLSFDEPKTSAFIEILHNLKIDRSCLVTTEKHDPVIYKSLRNIPRVDSLEVAQLNAGDILRRQKLLFTRAALERLINPTAEKTEPADRNKPEIPAETDENRAGDATVPVAGGDISG